ncbi:MAG: hypothetical protein QF473_31720, partial [Planctomycetota bacterium]|nr:hypothetical protein [Planctomycetota bacterium]
MIKAASLCFDGIPKAGSKLENHAGFAVDELLADCADDGPLGDLCDAADDDATGDDDASGDDDATGDDDTTPETFEIAADGVYP